MKYIKNIPPQIVCKGRIKVGNKYVNRFDADIIDYANRHQLTIAIDINEAKKLLGDVEDPIQSEAEHIVGTTSIIPPKPFPAALPCCIKIDGETLYPKIPKILYTCFKNVDFSSISPIHVYNIVLYT